MSPELQTIIKSSIEEFKTSIEKQPLDVIKGLNNVLKLEHKKTYIIYKECLKESSNIAVQDVGRLDNAKNVLDNLAVLMQLLEDRVLVCETVIKIRNL